jgi:hypothetical protein
MTNQPLETLQCPFFQSMVLAANNKVPCGTSAETVRKRTQQQLVVRGRRMLWEWQTNGDGESFQTSITTDAWTSKAGDGHIVLTAHVIDGHWNMCPCTAGMAATSILGHTALQHTEELRSLLLNAGIANVAAVTVDTEATMQKLGDVLSGIAPATNCCDHLLNLVAWAILKHPAIINVVDDTRTHVHAFRKSSQARATLKTLMRAAGQKPSNLQADVATRWWSTFSMVHRLLELREHLLRDDHITDVELVNSHWQVARALCHVLKPLRDFQLGMEAEKHVTTSLLPVCLETARQSMDGDAFMLKADGSSLRADLRLSSALAPRAASALDAGRAAFVNHFRNPEERPICARAATASPNATGRMRGIPSQAWIVMLLDPRVKHLTNFLSAEEVEGLWPRLHSLMGVACNCQGTTDEDSDDVQEAPGPSTPKRSRREGVVNEILSSVAKFASDDRTHLQRQCRAERDSHLASETTKCRVERPLPMNEIPLAHWKKKRACCPMQPSNGASERRNSQLSLLIRSNRASLKPEAVEDIHTLKGVFAFLELNPSAWAKFTAK